MQDEVNSKVVALSVRVTGKGLQMSKEVLKAAMRKWLLERDKQKNVKIQKKIQKSREPTHGKQTVKELMKQNQGLTNIEITDQNIKSFERIANKYNIDFALKKEKGSEPPKYVVFFKARDVDVMTHAFKEYSAKELNKVKKPSVKKLLVSYIGKVKQKANEHDKNRQRQRDRGKER